MLGRATDKIEGLLPEEARIERVGAIHGGWDDGVTIAIGESRATVIVYAHNMGEMPDIEAQTISLVRHLEAREQIRAIDRRADDNSFIWLYESG